MHPHIIAHSLISECTTRNSDDSDNSAHDKLGGEEELDLSDICPLVGRKVKDFQGGPDGLIIATRGPTTYLVQVKIEGKANLVVRKVQLLQIRQLS